MVDSSGAAPPLSVVVATRDRSALLRACLNALRRHLRPGDEVLVVDSASRDPEMAVVCRRAGVSVLRLELPGTSRARNAGLASAAATIVAFVDDDCMIEPGWAEAVERVFDDPAVGFATGRVVADRQMRLPVSIVAEDTPRRFVAGDDPMRLGGGANMAFRRTALEAVRGFDERMGPATRLLAAEDHDAFARLLRAGWAGVYEPSMQVTHQQWRGTGRAIMRQYAYGVGAGALTVKLIRSGEPSGWPMLRGRLWRDGVMAAIRNIGKGYETGAAAAVVKAVGVLVGVARASRTPLRDGHFGR